MKKSFLSLFILLFIYIEGSSFQQVEYDLKQYERSIQHYLDSIYDDSSDFAGATIGIILPDGQKASFAVGYNNVEKGIKMKPLDRMLGGSTGKIFVSASLMQLYEKGKLDLDDKASKYLAQYTWFDRIQNSNSITIRNLMQHTSGISRYVFGETFQTDIHQDPDKVWKPEELLSYVFDLEPLFAAGTDFAYSDTNYIILALILEEITGVTMYEYIEENIITPFELADVSPQTSRKLEGLANGYNGADDPFFSGIVAENETYKYNVQFEWAGGGFIVTSTDLALAGKLIYENKMFGENIMNEFLNGVDAKQLRGTWGLGVHIQNTPYGKTYGHSGFFPGYITNMVYFPEHKISFAMQVNTSDREKSSLYRKLFKLIPVAIKNLEFASNN